MKFVSTLVLAMASMAVAKGHAKGNGTEGMMGMMSTKAQCKQVSKLTKLVDIAGNTTKLTEVTDGNATRAAEIQAKASQAQTKLTALQSNATLMTACDQMFAMNKMEDQCEMMMGLQKLNALIANQTALDMKTDNNATKADMLKSKAQAKAADLSAMEKNTTLTAFCAGFSDKQSCKAMARFAKEKMWAANTTALDEHFDGNQAKIAKFQAQMSKQEVKINALMSNSTLMDECNSLGITVASTTSGSSSSSNSTDDKKSAAASVSALGAGHVLALGSALACAVAML